VGRQSDRRHDRSGPDAVPFKTATLDSSTWTVHIEAERAAKGNSAAVRYVIDGKLSNLGSYNRTLTGTWMQAEQGRLQTHPRLSDEIEVAFVSGADSGRVRAGVHAVRDGAQSGVADGGPASSF
jgi:hypothetical protein